MDSMEILSFAEKLAIDRLDTKLAIDYTSLENYTKYVQPEIKNVLLTELICAFRRKY